MAVVSPGRSGRRRVRRRSGWARQLTRPDVALAFDRMDRAARADGVALIVTSAFRSDAEQAELWRRHPDPRWVAPPGKSLHRNATELDLGPSAAYGWLAGHATRFHFVQRYSWEPWHQEAPLALNQRTAAVPTGRGAHEISKATASTRAAATLACRPSRQRGPAGSALPPMPTGDGAWILRVDRRRSSEAARASDPARASRPPARRSARGGGRARRRSVESHGE
jgi:D-alanyl-D-alanine carboxypeptidase-like protein